MAQDTVYDVLEEVEDTEEDAANEFMEQVVAHMKMGLKSRMSPVTLKMKSGQNSQMRSE